jgi:hypothetical protein
MQEQHRQNLLKLAAHLEKKPSLWRRLLRVKFSMHTYAANPRINRYDLYPEELLEARRCPRHYCGTVMCALGEAVLLFPNETKLLEFSHVARELFDIPAWSDSWDWLFHSNWEAVDNTREGVASRIRWYLEHGLPENWRQYIKGEALLCYRIG